jgi:parallel beta-helix repeat protein
VIYLILWKEFFGMRMNPIQNNTRLCVLTILVSILLIPDVTGTVILNDTNLQGTAGSQHWVINSPGDYFINVSSGALITSNQYAILIRASDVNLDGNNITLHNSGSGSYGVWAQNGVLNNINVKNFSIDSYGSVNSNAVDYENVYGGSIRNITATKNNVGIWTYNSSFLTIENCDMHGGNNYGIFLDIHCTNNHIRNNQIHDNDEGMYVIESDNNFIYLNNASNNTNTGIYLGYMTQTDNNTVYGNTALKNKYGILLDRYCDNNTVYSNTVRNNRMGGIMLVMDAGNTVFNNTVSDTTEVGIFLEMDNHDNEIYNNTVLRNHHGIIIDANCSRNNIYENTVSANTDRGIWITGNSTYNNAYSNNITGNAYGLFVHDSSYNIIENNSVTVSTSAGLYLDGTSTRDEFRKNRVMNNPVGIYMFNSSNEKIVNNYFNNTNNISLHGTHVNNVWNYTKTAGKNIMNGPYLGGNFYGSPTGTGFSQFTPDTNRDGLCDSTYPIPRDDASLPNNIDYLPLHVYYFPHMIGVFRDGFWILDGNGNYAWDGTGTGKDIVAGFGMTGDKPVVGNWNTTTPGDKVGVFREGTWLIDYNGNFAWDGSDKYTVLGEAGDTPVIGDWNSNGNKKIGVFRDGFWILDGNGNYAWDGTGTGKDIVAGFGMTGDVPVAADWLGTGQDKIGVFRDGFWILDGNGNYGWDGTGTGNDIVAGFGMAGDVPVPRDWNGDGASEIAVFRPGTGQWIIDYNGNFVWDGTGSGQDVTASLGQTGDVAVAGDWDSTSTGKLGVFRNGFWILDYNGNFIWDGTPSDKVVGFGTTGDVPVAGKWS